jgi:hypothetical protein
VADPRLAFKHIAGVLNGVLVKSLQIFVIGFADSRNLYFIHGAKIRNIFQMHWYFGSTALFFSCFSRFVKKKVYLCNFVSNTTPI